MTVCTVCCLNELDHAVVPIKCVCESYFFMKKSFQSTLTFAFLLVATLAAPLSATALITAPGDLTLTLSGNNLILSFPTTSTNYYGLQTRPDLLQPWTNIQAGISGNGYAETITMSNAISARQGFYRVLIQPKPVGLVLPQSDAFAILGHSCGSIHEQVYGTGFDPTNGYPTGDVHLSTSCSSGGRGSQPTTYTAWAAVTWDFAGNVISWTTPASGAANPALMATDALGDIFYNVGANAYLIVPVPAAPAGVTAVQSGDQFQVSWTPKGVNPAAVTSSTLTATPVNSPASILTTTVAGPAMNGAIASLQPQTTYQITVVNTTIGGSSPASTPISVTTEAASVAPSAPTNVMASWLNLEPSGATDTLVATWPAAVPGDSPIDQYQVTITGSDGSGTFTQTVSGTTLTASFTVDYIPNWTVTVRAHNAFGWGPSSTVITLGGL